MHPVENFFVAATFQRACFDKRIRHSKEPTATAIKGVELSIAEQQNVVGRKRALLVKANLVDHSTKVDQSANLGVATSESWNVRHDASIREDRDFRNRHRIAVAECAVLRGSPQRGFGDSYS